MELSPVFNEIKKIKKWNKRNGDLMARSDSARFPGFEKKYKFKKASCGRHL